MTSSASKFARFDRHLGVLLACAFVAYCLSCVVAQSPYPANWDEQYIMEHAWNIVTTGDLNPHFFNYGSLPIYLTAAGLRIGAWIAQLSGQITELSEVGPICFPYYAHSSISIVPRLLFPLFGGASLIAVARLGRALHARPEALLTPIFVLAFMPLFQQQSLVYINVDILVTALVTSALAYLACTSERESLAARALIPACFCGAALATKYNAGLLMLPFVCAAARAPWRRCIAQLACFGVATLGVFLLCQPYALLSFTEFSEGMLSELHHYRTGHAGYDAEPGLPQLQYYAQTFHKELGWIAWGLIALGAIHGVRKQRRLALLVLSFPVASFAFMIQQRVHFARNLLPAVAVLSAFSGLGLCWLVELATALLARWRRTRAVPTWTVSAGLVLALLGCMTLSRTLAPSGVFARPRPDSRTRLANWFRNHADRARCTVYVPGVLAVKPETIEPYCALRTIDVPDGANMGQLVAELAAQRTRPESYFAMPPLGAPPGGDWAEADPWNNLPAQLQLGRPLKRFGAFRMRMNRRAGGDPKVELYRLDAP